MKEGKIYLILFWIRIYYSNSSFSQHTSLTLSSIQKIQFSKLLTQEHYLSLLQFLEQCSNLNEGLVLKTVLVWIESFAHWRLFIHSLEEIYSEFQFKKLKVFDLVNIKQVKMTLFASYFSILKEPQKSFFPAQSTYKAYVKSLMLFL